MKKIANTSLWEKLIFLSASLLVFVSGCLNYEQTTWLNSDASGNMEIHYWTDLSNVFKDESSNSEFSFNEKNIKSNFDAKGIEIQEIKVWSELGDSIQHASIKIKFDDINILQNCRFFKESKIEFKDGAEGQKVFNQRISGSTSSDEFFDKYRLLYTYYFPGEVITDNATEKDGNQLRWRFKLSEIGQGKNLTATIRIKKFTSFSDLAVIIGLILIIALWIILIVRNKKKLQRESESV